MKTIERYVVGSFLTAFVLAWLVLTFVLSIGLLVKVTSLIAKGMPVAVVGSYFLAGVPETMGFTIPLAVLIGALLVFGRMSADSEIAAMRACGINLLRVMLWPLVLALLLSGVCLYIHNEITPRSDEVKARLVADARADLGLDAMEPGKFNPLPGGLSIWFARRDGDWLSDVLIFDKTKTGLDRETRAARLHVIQQGNDLVLDLYDVWIDPIYEDRPGAAKATRFSHTVVNAFKPANRVRKVRNYTFGELVRRLDDTAAQDDPVLAERLLKSCPDCRAHVCKNAYHGRVLSVHRLTSELRVEFHKRLALSCAAFCFALIGMPLGIRAHRRESTVGVAIGLAVALAFYLSMILADALKQNSALHPHLIPWIPVVLCATVAAVLIPRHQ